MKYKQSLSERIIEAAKQLFFQKGYFATNTREIANAAGTSESGIFRLFTNKFDLLIAVYNSCWKQVNEYIDSKVTIGDDPRDQLIGIIESFWELYSLQPLMMTFVLSNFGSADTLLIAREDEAIITKEGNLYIKRIENLCNIIVQNGLVDRRITAGVLREYSFSVAEGVLIGWYLADKTAGKYPGKVGIKEALIPLSLILYPEKLSCDPLKSTRGATS